MSLRSTLDFLLCDWLRAEFLDQRPRFADHSRETFNAEIGNRAFCSEVNQKSKMPLYLRLIVASVCLFPLIGGAQLANLTAPADCAKFLGSWIGTWSQGYYGKQRILVSHISDQCIASLGYSPSEEVPTKTRPMPIQAGAIAFDCNVPGGSCRMQVKGDELLFTYTEPSGFINTGTFRKELALGAQ
jgi:hypothetical protein